MLNDSQLAYLNPYNVKHNLQDLTRRLERGMVLKGRILDHFDNDKYLVRIWGYNILTESKHKFDIQEEIELKVLEINPHIVFDLYHPSQSIEDHSTNTHTNIVVH